MIKNTTQDIKTGITFALTAAVLFSIKPVLIKFSYQYGGDALSIMAIRAAFSLPFYLVMLVWLCRNAQPREQVKKHGWQAACVGVLGYYVASYLDILSLEYISAQLERLVIFLFPTFVVLISWVVLKQRPAKGTFLSVFLGYVGIAFIVAYDLSYLGNDVWLGSALAVGSAFIFAVYLILSKSLISKMGSQLFTCLGMGSAGGVILFQSQVSSLNITAMSTEFIVLGIIIGVFCTVLPSFFVAAAMARLTPSHLSLTSNVGPAITAVFAVVLLDESFTVFHAIGMGLVVWSVVQLNWRKTKSS